MSGKSPWGSHDKVCKMSIFVHSRGVGGQIGSNWVHVVFEWPLKVSSCANWTMMSLNLRVCYGPAMKMVAVCWHKSYHDDARYAFFLSLFSSPLIFFQITAHTYFLKSVHAISQLVQF